MLRALWFILLLAVLAAVAMWLADHPGQVSVVWQGYVIETSATVLVVSIAAVGALSAFAYRLWIFVRGVPAALARFRRDARRRRGYLALSRGMVAVAAGDPGEARRQAGRASDLLDQPSLTMLLSAQSAQLSGDEEAAQKFFNEMLGSPDTEFLGLRGLLGQAMKLENAADALKWARRAGRLKPQSAWVARTLFDLTSRAGLWAEADEALAVATRNKHVSPSEARRPRAVLGHLMSIDAGTHGEHARALKLAKKSCQEAPDLSPAHVHFAGLLKAAGKDRKAANTLEAAWAIIPTSEIALAYLEMSGPDASADVMAGVKAAQGLAAFNPKAPASALIVARAALKASLWGDARKALKGVELSEIPISGSYCQLMAGLEEAENQDLIAAREWLVRAASAEPDPTWVCEDCGNAADSWTALCGACGGFDKFQWRLPFRVPGLAPPASGEMAKLTSSAALQDVDAQSEAQ
jgi:HemY protein